MKRDSDIGGGDMDAYTPLLCSVIRFPRAGTTVWNQFPTQDPAMSADTLANTDLALGIPIVWMTE